MVAARRRRAPTCSSVRSRTPRPSTPTPRHMMCTLGRPIPRTANETVPNVVSVLMFCNQATALLQQQQKDYLPSSSSSSSSRGRASSFGRSSSSRGRTTSFGRSSSSSRRRWRGQQQ